MTASKPRVVLWGRHANRTPMAYAPLRAALSQAFEFTSDPSHADLLVVGFHIDLVDQAAEVGRLLDRSPALRIVVISEEPLWDTVWGGVDPTETARRLVFGGHVRSVDIVNHFNSRLFDFDAIPYFLTTDDKYILRYGLLISSLLSLSSDDLLRRWRAAPHRTAFMCERRVEAGFDVLDGAGRIIGLSGYRSRLAAALPDGQTLRIGKGWPGTEGLRQQLPDWHLDKLASLTVRVGLLSGIENSVAPHYLTEKAFDAFAIGAIPIVYGAAMSGLDRVMRAPAYLDLVDLSVDAAAAKLQGFRPTRAFADQYRDALHELKTLFLDASRLDHERRRFARALTRILSERRTAESLKKHAC